MWNTNDFDAANEHIEDLRRAAEKHNAVARMKAASQGGQANQAVNQAANQQPVNQQPVNQQPGKDTDKKPQNLWERVRNSLR